MLWIDAIGNIDGSGYVFRCLFLWRLWNGQGDEGQKKPYEEKYILPYEMSDWVIWLVIHFLSSSECSNKRCMSDPSAAGSFMSLSRSVQEIWRLRVLRYVDRLSTPPQSFQQSNWLQPLCLRFEFAMCWMPEKEIFHWRRYHSIQWERPIMLCKTDCAHALY